MKLQSENSLTVVKNISKITNFLNSSIAEDFWTDWKWQIKHSIRDIETFEKKLGIKFPLEEKMKLQKTIERFPMSITPYYLSLIEADNYSNDPIFRQAFPSIEEMNIDQSDLLDPLGEDKDSPITGITHRYPDRVLFHVSNRCAMYCRHCTRKRKVGDVDFIPTKEELLLSLKIFRNMSKVQQLQLKIRISINTRAFPWWVSPGLFLTPF